MNKYRVTRQKYGVATQSYWLETRLSRHGAPWTVVAMFPDLKTAKEAETAAFQREIAKINASLHVIHTGTTAD